ncbi:MAG: hypothetical protein HQM12_00060 [SAR324 cluster bacterium]|nr:hypothetical protein [SAR324 cluster bacterium]
MIRVETVTQQMFSEVFQLLKDLRNHNLLESDFRSIFDYPWKNKLEYPGYVLFDDDKIVGFIGTIFCERILNNKVEKFCSITSWVVKEQYRDQSLRMLLPIVRLKDYTITVLTLKKDLLPLFQKLKFKILETETIIIPPIPKISIRSTSSISITMDEAVLKSKLNDQDARIYKDHLTYDCYHLLVYDQYSYCYILFSKARKRGFKFNRIHYISNIKLFAKNSIRINFRMIQYSKVFLTVLDSRFCRDISIPHSIKFRLRSDKIYKSSSLDAHMIDNLYTEYILLRI